MELRLHPALQRAQLLAEHKRYTEAEREIRHLLAERPDEVMALIILTEILLAQEKLGEAEEAAQQLLQLEPASGISHYLMARLREAQERNREAIDAIQTAIRLDPTDPDYHGLHAIILFGDRQHDAALEAAEKGLSLDPEHLNCLNVRSRLLFKLGRKQEAVETIDKALEQDPDNAITHANYGWACLEKGDPKQALVHFRASLQQDPTLEFSKEGMKEALKGRYWVYRQYLRYSFWIGNRSKQQQWIFLIGLYVAFRFLRSVADSNENLAPFLWPLIGLYLLFAVSSWLMQPLGNLFLMLNTYGRYILTESERKAARMVGVALGISLLSFLIMAFTDSDTFFILGFVAFTLMVPLGSMDRPSRPKDRRFLRICTLAMLALGLGAALLEAADHGIAYTAFITYILGFLGYQFLANAKIAR